MRSLTERALRESAQRMRLRLSRGVATPAQFRTALMSVPAARRDVWFDLVLGLGELPDDGPELPRACVPYMPCSVEILLRMVDDAKVHSADVFVDIGSGLGRAVLLMQFLTGASAIGLEIQPALVRASRELATSLKTSRISVVEGDAAILTGSMTIGSVFFLYCPFSGERLERALDGLESIARTRQIRVCCVGLPLLSRPWLTLVSPLSGDLAIYRSPPIHEWRSLDRERAAFAS
jgi:SAM-dependent methyltransferase